MSRVFILVMDSLGIGSTPDAIRFGDVGSNTLGHIAQWRMEQKQPLKFPNLEKLGLGAAMQLASGNWPLGCEQRSNFIGAYAAAKELSYGKDTPSGHWEMTGLPVEFDWGYFPAGENCFPVDFLNQWIERCQLPGVLGEKAASGTTIINELGDEHIASGKPIVYTSADSVFQVAAHEEVIPLERLYEICQAAFELLQPLNIARVIARPFLGQNGNYQRTSNRKDIAVPPPGETLLDVAKANGNDVIAIGKIGDIFAHRGITDLHKAPNNAALFSKLKDQLNAPEGALVFVNFVDFDQNFGHRRDLAGYANALEEFDALLPEFMEHLQEGDLAVITADHGCDPSWPGSDHTREYVPQLYFGPQVPNGNLGIRESFADLGQTLASHLELPKLKHGTLLFSGNKMSTM